MSDDESASLTIARRRGESPGGRRRSSRMGPHLLPAKGSKKMHFNARGWDDESPRVHGQIDTHLGNGHLTRAGSARITAALPPDLGLGTMQPYRCYFLDGANHIVKVESVQLPDDGGAVEWTEDLRRRFPRASPRDPVDNRRRGPLRAAARRVQGHGLGHFGARVTAPSVAPG